MKKSQIAGILFGVAMGVLFSVSLGTVGFVLGASFASLGMVMFKGLDDPQDKDKKYKKASAPHLYQKRWLLTEWCTCFFFILRCTRCP